MPRQQRIHVPEGTYYIVQRGSSQHPVFSQPEDYALFEHVLPDALNRTGARLHAYCWTGDAIHLTLQIDGRPVGDFMRALTSRYARCVHQRTGERGWFFGHRYQSVLIDPDAYLLRLIHYLHHVPVLQGLTRRPDDYPHTSHRVYLGAARVPWVHTQTALRLLDSFDDDRVAYRRFMSDAPLQKDMLFERGNPDTPGILGGPEFLSSLPRRVRPYRSRLTLNEIIENVTCALGLSREHVLSNSRQRDVVLARAVIAWHATERRVASLHEVARRLRRDSSSLSKAISRYRVSRRELFTLDAFRSLVPIAPRGPVGHDWLAGGEGATEQRDEPGG